MHPWKDGSTLGGRAVGAGLCLGGANVAFALTTLLSSSIQSVLSFPFVSQQFVPWTLQPFAHWACSFARPLLLLMLPSSFSLDASPGTRDLESTVARSSKSIHCSICDAQALLKSVLWELGLQSDPCGMSSHCPETRLMYGGGGGWLPTARNSSSLLLRYLNFTKIGFTSLLYTF